MLAMLVCFMLVFLPLVTIGAVLIGGRIYHAGQSGQQPTTGVNTQKFAMFRRNGNGAARREEDKLPSV